MQLVLGKRIYSGLYGVRGNLFMKVNLILKMMKWRILCLINAVNTIGECV